MRWYRNLYMGPNAALYVEKVRRRADANKSNMKSRSVFRAAGVHCGIFYLSIYPFPRTATMNFASKRSSSFLRIYLI